MDFTELRKQANANLARILDGTVAREKTKAQERKAAEKEQAAADRKFIKELDKRIKAQQKERGVLQEYLNGLLLDEDPNPLGYAEGMTKEQRQGLIEECDHVVEQLTDGICKLMDERDMLKESLPPKKDRRSSFR